MNSATTTAMQHPKTKFSTAKSRSPAHSPQWRQGQCTVSSEDYYFRPRTRELVESKNRPRTLELRSFSVQRLSVSVARILRMNSNSRFEFLTKFKLVGRNLLNLAVGRNFYWAAHSWRLLKKKNEYCEFSFSLAKNIACMRAKNNCARMRSLKSELAKLTDSIARQASC